MSNEGNKKRILFMCIHNSARSQMAEGFFKEFYGDMFEVHSAGSDTQELDPLAVKVMAEIGMDISTQTSSSLKDFEGQEFDYVATICGNPYHACPFFIGGKKYFKQPFDDLSSFEGDAKAQLEFFRTIRDELGDWIQDLFNYHIKEICGDNQSPVGCCTSNNTKNNMDNSCC